MSAIEDKVLGALRKHGAMRMQKLGMRAKCSYIATVVRKLREEGKVKTSAEKRNAAVALPEQNLEDAPAADASAGAAPATKRAGKKNGNGKAKPARRAKRDPGDEFDAAITTDMRLVLLGLAPDPIILSEHRTEKIASLVLANFSNK